MTPHITLQAPLAPAPASADLSGDGGPFGAAGSGERSPGASDFDAVLDAELHDRARPGDSADDHDPKPVPPEERPSRDVADRDVADRDRADRGAADPHSLGSVVATQSAAVGTEPIALDQAGRPSLDIAPEATVDGDADPTAGAHFTADVTVDVGADAVTGGAGGNGAVPEAVAVADAVAVDEGAVESRAPIDAAEVAEVAETAEIAETAGVKVGEPSSERSIERAAAPREQLAAEDDELRSDEPVADTAQAEPPSVERPPADPPLAEGEPLLIDEPPRAEPVLSDSVLSESVLSDSVLSDPVLSESVLSDSEPAERVPSGSVPADPDGSRDVELESEPMVASKPDSDTDVDPEPDTTDTSASPDGAETPEPADTAEPVVVGSASDVAEPSAEKTAATPASPESGSPASSTVSTSITSAASSIFGAASEPANTVGDQSAVDASSVDASSVDASSVDVDLDGAWDPIRQIMSRVRATGDGHDLRLRLHPADLGEVAVQVRTQGGELTVSVVTSTAAARDALQADRTLLLDELADAGFDGDRVDVSLGTGDDGGDDAATGRGHDERAGGSDSAIGARGPEALRPGRRSLGDALVVPTLGRRDATVNLTL